MLAQHFWTLVLSSYVGGCIWLD